MFFFLAGGVPSSCFVRSGSEIWYVSENRPVEETVDVAPELGKHVARAMSDNVRSISIKSQELLYTSFRLF